MGMEKSHEERWKTTSGGLAQGCHLHHLLILLVPAGDHACFWKHLRSAAREVLRKHFAQNVETLKWRH